MSKKPNIEITLDPQNWESLETLGHKMLEDMMKHLKTIRDRPIMQRPPDEVRQQFMAPPPMMGQGPEKTYDDFKELILKNQSNFNKDPRFWGFVVGTGSPSGMLADMLASGLNVNMVGGPLVSTMVELQVTAWLKGMMGYPMTAGGILVSGGSMATLLGLTVARNTKSKTDIKKTGVQGRMILYGSDEMHVCIQKSVEILGIGNDNLRKIPTDKDHKIDISKLEKTIKRDRDAGYQPFCIIGNAGTVNTGAFDDLDALADIAEAENLWFHVDGAFGAWAKIVQELQTIVKGIERADSLAFDLHKWMYLPYEVGCVLFKNERDQFNTFSNRPDYFGLSKEYPPEFADYGYELSRSFRALKVWMSFKEHGVAKFSGLVSQNVQQARYLAELIKSKPELELLAPVPLNTVCFRYKGKGLPDAALNELNKGLMMQLMFTGAGAASETKLDDKLAMRVCITNHRTTRDDLMGFVEAAVNMGNGLVAKMMPS